ncbi:glycoside hydrolase family 1 protein [Pseudoduganella umbonata]|uniref:Beta-glucosidase n=1 Tax=Pseudoduganella umbonata TaxID=864828 RepID=A0A4P8I005_9BURK|nr:family 1 glycosylhydrolase [Pseudoduganella umbonata]MBB3221890.1 beta-glucosidase [Pseudoduganella umbonata]QCP14310.1 glycoside hydrolase family 1 protein [Pseudoduganella umbonata]
MTDQFNNGSTPDNPRRRTLLGFGTALAGAAMLPGAATAAAATKAKGPFPKGFLWGAAIAGHQAEGDNVNSDAWLLENVQPTEFKEPSAAGVDHYRLFDQDIGMLAQAGLNTFRFSIEWARVEPVEGLFSVAALEHYRDVLEACRKRGVRTMVSFNHFVNPRWFAARGGWEAEGAAELFARYCDKVTRHLGHLIDYATTFNEPNLARLLFGIPGPLSGMAGNPRMKAMLAEAARQTGSDKFSAWLFGDFDRIQAGQLLGHAAAYQAVKAVRPQLPVGFSIAIADDQAVGDPAMRDRKRAIAYEPWFKAINEHGDFFGVQTYTRELVGPEGVLPPPKDAVMTSAHMEYYPQALEATLRYTAQHVKKPLYVTENGTSTDDDKQRVAYIGTAVAGVASCLKDGIDVRGYVHWSLLDNFEWIFGYGPRFGLIDVDRKTMKRTAKPSLAVLGRIARANGV